MEIIVRWTINSLWTQLKYEQHADTVGQEMWGEIVCYQIKFINRQCFQSTSVFI